MHAYPGVPTRRRARQALAAVVLTFVASMSGLVLTAGPAQAGTVYTEAYSSSSKCYAAQNEIIHSPFKRLTESCFKYQYSCFPGCLTAWGLRWTYKDYVNR